MLALCAFLMVPYTTLLILCATLSYSVVTLCYSATAHSAYAPLQLESARLYTTVGARVGLAPSASRQATRQQETKEWRGLLLLGPACPSRGGGSSLPKGKSERGTRLRGGIALAEQLIIAKSAEKLLSAK